MLNRRGLLKYRASQHIRRGRLKVPRSLLVEARSRRLDLRLRRRRRSLLVEARSLRLDLLLVWRFMAFRLRLQRFIRSQMLS